MDKEWAQGLDFLIQQPLFIWNKTDIWDMLGFNPELHLIRGARVLASFSPNKDMKLSSVLLLIILAVGLEAQLLKAVQDAD